MSDDPRNPKNLAIHHGLIVDPTGKVVDYIHHASDPRRWWYPLYIPAGHVRCPGCKGSGEAERSFWDWMFGKHPLCDVCNGRQTIKRGPLPPPPPPKKVCQHCGGSP